MRLIFVALLLAFAVFFTSIEPSAQSGRSNSSQGSNGRGSGQRENLRARPSHSVESGESAESGSSRIPAKRRHLVPLPLRGQQETSRYSGHSEPSRPTGQQEYSRHSGPSRPRIIFENSGNSRDSSSPEPVEDSRPNSPLEQRQSVSSMMPTPPRPYSPTRPFSYQYNSPSQTSDSGSNNVSPWNSPQSADNNH